MTAVPCPGCSAPLTGTPRCPACSLNLTGPVAARLWTVDTQLAALTCERGELLAALRQSPADARAGERAQPDGTTPDAALTLTPGTRGSSWFSPAAPQFAQRALLAVGALLLLVGASVFLAVAWGTIGVGGQVLTMLAATGAAAVAASQLQRRGLRSSAEAAAAVSAGMLLLDVSAARALGLGSLGRVDVFAYTTIAGLACAAALAAAHARPGHLRAYAVVAGLAASTGWGALVAWSGQGPTNATWIALAGAVTFWLAAHLFGPALPALRSALLSQTVSWLAAATVTGLTGAALRHRPALPALAAVIVVAVVAVLGCVTSIRTARTGAESLRAWVARPLSKRWRAASAFGGVVAVSVPGAVTAVVWHTGTGGAVAAATVCGAGAVLAADRLRSAVTGRWVALAVLCVASLSSVTVLSVGRGSVVAVTACLAAAGVVSAAAAWWHEAVRGATAGAASLFAGAAAWAATWHGGATRMAFALLAVAVCGAVVAALRRGRDEEAWLGGAAAVVAMFAVLVGLDSGAAAAVTSAVALTACAYAALPARAVLSWLAATLGAVAWGQVLDGALWAPAVVEVWSVPAAVAAAAAGMWVRRARRRPMSSWLVNGPAALLAVGPSAAVALGQSPGVRSVLVLVAACAFLLVGVAMSQQSLVLTGSAVCVAIALHLLGPVVLWVPRWVVLTTAGVLLLVVGVTYESRLRQARRAGRWVAGLR